MKKLLNWLKDEESGQGMVEYGLILGLIAVVVIGILTTMGTGILARFTEINGAVNPAPAPAPAPAP